MRGISMPYQSIAVGGTIVGSKRRNRRRHTAAAFDTLLGLGARPGATESTDRLKGALAEYGRLAFVDFLDEEQRQQRLESTNKALRLKWNVICKELENPKAEVSVALLGHMRREFHYYWRGWDPQWTPNGTPQ